MYKIIIKTSHLKRCFSQVFIKPIIRKNMSSIHIEKIIKRIENDKIQLENKPHSEIRFPNHPKVPICREKGFESVADYNFLGDKKRLYCIDHEKEKIKLDHEKEKIKLDEEEILLIKKDIYIKREKRKHDEENHSPWLDIFAGIILIPASSVYLGVLSFICPPLSPFFTIGWFFSIYYSLFVYDPAVKISCIILPPYMVCYLYFITGY